MDYTLNYPMSITTVVNAAINMLNAGKEWLLHKRRPPALCKAAYPKLAQTPKLVKSQAQPQGGITLISDVLIS